MCSPQGIIRSADFCPYSYHKILIAYYSYTGKMACTHGHRTDSAWISVVEAFPIWTKTVYKRTEAVRKGARMASVYSRLSPSYARVYGTFSLCYYQVPPLYMLHVVPYKVLL